MARTFDYSAFRAAFVKAAQAHGIDPMAGATSYQVATLKADARKQAILAAPDYGWWRGREIFSDVTETRPVRPSITIDETLATWTVEVLNEIARELRQDVPLSTLQTHQKAWAEATASRKRALWLPGAGLPERQLIPSY